jgi:hypothetical protein
MSIGLYWCTTKDGGSDYWVVAETPHEACGYFGVVHGYLFSQVRARRVKEITPEDIIAQAVSIPCDPTKEQLAAWDVKYNSNFHVFHIGKKIYRPEGMVRAMMITHARLARSGHGRGKKSASSESVGPSSTSTT